MMPLLITVLYFFVLTCIYLFIHSAESATVHHHRAGDRHGGQPQLWPLQHSHRHHLRQGHQRQPAHADLQDGELTPSAGGCAPGRTGGTEEKKNGGVEVSRVSSERDPRSRQRRFTVGRARVVESKGRSLALLCGMLFHTHTRSHEN